MSVDMVRLLIGDTATPALLEDADIQDFLDARTVVLNDGSEYVNVPAAAADCAGALVAQYGHNGFDFSEDGQSFNRSQRVGHFMNLERELRNRSGGVMVPIAGSALT
jgi:hypothetical protein